MGVSIGGGWRRAAMEVGAAVLREVREGKSEAEAVQEVAHGMAGLLASAHLVVAQRLPIFAARWAACGFPTVEPSARLGASLLATGIKPDLVPDVALPWSAFCILVPPGTIGFSWIIVMRSQRGSIRYFAFGTEQIGLGDEADLAGFADKLETMSENGSIMRPPGATDRDAENSLRQTELIGRLIIGCCIELDQPKHRVVISNGPPPPKGKRGRAPEPKSWMFQLTRDVKVDCREWVTSYLSGKEGTKASVQSLVRGHHKRQAHGPEMSLRKWIHVEPYWRGPEDAPIAVRSHQLGAR